MATCLQWNWMNLLQNMQHTQLMVILARLTDMLKNSDESIGYSTPNSIVNRLFYRVFSIETILVNKTNLPFGASIVAVCRKT